MELTIIQKQLIALLTKYIKDKESIIGTMLFMKTKNQQEKLIDYIIENKNNTSKNKILKQVELLITKN